MRKRHNGPGRVVAAAVLALAAGVVTALPATAVPWSALPSAAASPTGTGTSVAPVTHWITLITGDRVGVSAEGEPVRIVPGEGREKIPVRVERTKDHTLVLPLDARPLIDKGQVDERLFDLKELFDLNELDAAPYRKRQPSGTGLIVSYQGAAASGAALKAARSLRSELRSDAGVKLRHALPAIGAEAVTEAVTVSDAAAKDVWKTLTRPSGPPLAGQRAADPGLRRISLDDMRGSSLDASTAGAGAGAGAGTGAGAGESVRTSAAVEGEVDTYEVTVRHIGADGEPATTYSPTLYALSGSGVPGENYAKFSPTGVYTARLPKGVYYLDALFTGSDGAQSQITAPHFEVTKNTTVTVDARTAKPIGITGPDPAAHRVFAEMFTELNTPELRISSGITGTSFANLRSAQLGPDFAAEGTLYQGFNALDINGTKEYRFAYGGNVTRLATGFERQAKLRDMAKIGARLGTTVAGKQGMLIARPIVPDIFGSIFMPGVIRPLPVATTTYVTTAADTDWVFGLDQYDDTGTYPELTHGTGIQHYEAGRSYRRDLGVGVFGPALVKGEGVSRDGDEITGCVDLLRDGTGNTGYGNDDTVKATLYRDGVEVASSPYLLSCWNGVTVPAASGDFRLTATASRPAPSAAPTEVTATWTFTSGHTTAEEALPVSVVRLAPRLDADSTARAGAVTRIPVRVVGAAAGANLKSLTIEVSYDGTTWKKAKVVRNGFLVRNPATGKGISLRATVADRQGNTLTQTISNAYRGR